ncbi:MAG: MFS transporter [Actinomycetia bacterium]|nr:MFS transporter [Actinomycetes bacterium]
MSSAATPTTRRPRPTGLIIVTLALCGTLVSLQQTLVLPLLPDFPTILGTTADNATWLVTITLLASAVGTPVISRLADMFGKRLMLITCMWSVIIGSIVAALSTNLATVIIGRGLAGLGTCLVPIGISIMRDHLPSDRVGSGVALMSATLGIGGAVGMPLAGLIYENLDWHAIFLVSGGFAVMMLIAVHLVVPESTVKTRGRFDWLGAILLSVALTSFLLAVSKAGTWGWGSPLTLTLLVVAAIVVAAWVPWELGVGQPIVDIRTSTRRTVLLTNAASVLVGFAMFANFLTSVQQVQMPAETGYGFGLSVMTAGLVMLPGGLLMVAMAPVAGWLIRTYGPRAILIAGALVMAVGFVGRSIFHGSVVEVAVTSGIASLGTALAFAAMPTLIMASVPITETASANGLNTLLRAIGTSSASAMVAAVFTIFAAPVATGQMVPTFTAYQLVFWTGTLASLGGAAIAAFIRRPTRVQSDDGTTVPAHTREPLAVKFPGGEPEVIVRGRVTGPLGRPLRQAVATVLRPDGEHLDWSRADNEGSFALALPAEGRYLLVVSADGWAPHSSLVDLSADDPTHVILTRRLLLSGQVFDDGEPIGDVMIALIKHSGEYAGTTTADASGHYELGLPPPGRYVLTAVDHATGRTRSRTLAVQSSSMSLDIDLITAIPRRIEAGRGAGTA